MEKRYNISVSPVVVKQKPQSEDEKKIIHRSFISTGTTISEIVQNVSQPKGYSYSLAEYKDSKVNQNNFISLSGFGLDFDNTISIKEVLERFEIHGVKPNLYYTTLSHKDSAPRFRVFLLLEKPITDKKSAKNMMKALLLTFPEADELCMNVGGYFFGGIEGCKISENPVTYNQLEQMVMPYVISKDSGKTRKLVSKRDSLYYYSKPRNQTDYYKKYYNYLESLSDGAFDFELLAEKVKIFKDFVDGVWLYHIELFGIATSLHWLKGGAKYFNETMKRHNELGNTFYGEEKFSIMTYVKKKKYAPYSLSEFSKYEEDHNYTNLITAVRVPKNQIEILRIPETISLEVGEQKFNSEIKPVIEAISNKIYIFKLPTGFGKSEFLTNLKDVIIAFPTHALNKEMGNRMKSDVLFVVVPELPIFHDDSINKRIQAYYTIGARKEVINLLKSISNGEDSDAKIASEYLIKTQLSNYQDITVLTTHPRAIFSENNYSTMIFDEDPFQFLLPIKRTTISDLKSLNESLPEAFQFPDFLKAINDSKEGITYTVPKQSLNTNILCDKAVDNSIKTNILEFLTADVFIRDKEESNIVHYLKKETLPEGKKIILFSASPQTHIYKALYGDRVEEIDISNIEQVGSVQQDTSASFSRSSLNEAKAYEISENLGHIPVITFESHKRLFPNLDCDLHFGNTRGYDQYAGDDLAVVGTPHFNEAMYRLYAHVCGIDPNKEPEIKYRQVEYGNYRFSFRTFEDKSMQQIQLGLIESELIQAVGRSRTLRNECTVKVFSNLPLPITTEFIESKE